MKQNTPAGACLAIASKGDDELLQLEQRETRHFPCDDHGRYVGYHPADAAEAIARIQALQKAGVEFLLLPKSSLWWLNYYYEFAVYLDQHCPRVAQLATLGHIYRLKPA